MGLEGAAEEAGALGAASPVAAGASFSGGAAAAGGAEGVSLATGAGGSGSFGGNAEATALHAASVASPALAPAPSRTSWSREALAACASIAHT